ncbi:Transcriptional regulatory protein SrrA [compost metagenome]
MTIDADQRSVLVYGEKVELTPKEFDILFLLASHPKKVFSAEHIFGQVWGEAYYESGNTVMVHISKLRDKLEQETGDKLIVTVWGVGYKIDA